MRKTLAIPFGVLLLVLAGLGITLTSANATNSAAPPCVPQDAYTETIEHPAVTHEEEVMVDPGSPAVEAVPGQWWNFSPNNTQGPYEGTPSFPTDPGGTWQGPHTVGGPSQDLTGTFQQGEGNGSWFHREPGTPAQAEVPPTYETQIIVDEEAYTETIKHPAVVCSPPDEPPAEQPPVNVPPVNTPPAADTPDAPTLETVFEYRCGADGTLVKRTIHLRNGVKEWHKRENTSELCTSQTLDIQEEGM